MGYYIEQMEANFKMKKENTDKALEALKSVFVPENMHSYDYIDGVKHPHFAWIDTKAVLESQTFEDAMGECRWDLDGTETEFDSIYFNGEKYGGDEEIILNAIASYVEDGSYIQMLDEDGEQWRWVFSNGKVVEKYAKIIWD